MSAACPPIEGARVAGCSVGGLWIGACSEACGRGGYTLWSGKACAHADRKCSSGVGGGGGGGGGGGDGARRGGGVPPATPELSGAVCVRVCMSLHVREPHMV